jgi:hypothetical protein
MSKRLAYHKFIFLENKLERLARDKHSSLLQTLINYGRKKFYNNGPRGLYHETYYGRNLRIPVIS